MPLIDIQIKQLKPGPKAMRYADGKGLYIEVAPNGGKWWRFKYRFNGKEKRISLGVYPEVNLKDARALCEDARRLLQERVDPSFARQAHRASAIGSANNSFEAIAREWFEHRRHEIAENHSGRIFTRLEKDSTPEWRPSPNRAKNNQPSWIRFTNRKLCSHIEEWTEPQMKNERSGTIQNVLTK
jgi:hypothetical protein